MFQLSKANKKLISQKETIKSVIRGEQGTGKTLIGVERMLYLVGHEWGQAEKVLFVTSEDQERQRVRDYFNSNYHKQTVSLFEEALLVPDILSIDALMKELYTRFYGEPQKQIVEEVPSSLLQEAIIQVKKVYPRVKFLNEAGMTFVREELDWLASCHIHTLEAYEVVDRKGCTIKLPKKGKGRLAIWQLKECIEEVLETKGLLTKLAMEEAVLEGIKANQPRGYKHLIIDDAHKLTKVQLSVLRKLYQDGDLLFLIDKVPDEKRSAWLKPGQSFKQIGLDMTGRMRNLKVRKEAKKVSIKKEQTVSLTPLELFMMTLKPKVESEVKEKAVVSKLPWYVERYKYINKLTGIETVFQHDSSAGETYIDEVRQDEVEALPLYSEIAAGAPIEVVDEISSETFGLPSELLGHKKKTYMLHVQGDSMIGAQIEDGDYVVIQAGAVNKNEIAAVYYNGATTLKRIVEDDGQVLLVSENPKYAPIVIEDEDFRVMGRLVGVVKALARV